MSETRTERGPVKVFISYSHDSPAHSTRVLTFAAALRNHGVDVELDQFHTNEIVDWPRWCNEETSRDYSDFVLCVCTAEYCRRIEGKVPPEKGKGVYWEGSLLDDDIYDAKGNRRLIPVLFDNEPEASIPRFLRGWTFCRLGDFALADSGYEQVLRILTGQARMVKTPLGKVPDLPAQSVPMTSFSVAGSTVVATTRLRHGADRLVGREKELARLDTAWQDPKTHVVTIVAWGGVGKTALVVEWMARMARDGWRGAERVFDWSFYSQGTREQGAASADAFIAKALEFFGDPDMAKSATSAWDKGSRLAQLVAQKRTLLVLDGVEPLQYPPGPMGGQLKDPALEALLKGLALRNAGLCIVTTREPVSDLKAYRDTTSPEWLLEHLSEEAGAHLLLETGVTRAGSAQIRVDDRELKDAAREVGGHALTLQLLGRYLAKVHNGDVRKRDLIRFEKADAKVQGGHAFKVMAVYEKWLRGKGDEDALRQLAVLRLLGLFNRPADAGCLAALRQEPAIAGLTEPLVGLNDDDWNYAVANLVECGLISCHENESQIANRQYQIDCHPLIREYFANQLREKNPDAWRAGHRRLYEHLCTTTKESDQPTLEDLQPLYQAVAHGCLAGQHRRTWDSVYRARIARCDLDKTAWPYAARVLGAWGTTLACLGGFFKKQWDEPASELSTRQCGLVLQQAGWLLRGVGRFAEAARALEKARESAQENDNWFLAGVACRNLNQLYEVTGDLQRARRVGQDSIEFAKRSRQASEHVKNATRLAGTLHILGELAAAEECFASAGITDSCTQVFEPRSGYGFALLGDLLVSRGRCAEATQVVDKVLTAAETVQAAPVVPALANFVKARADIAQANWDDAKEHFGLCMEKLRTNGEVHQLPRGLLGQAQYYLLTKSSERCVENLNEAHEIAERSGMRLWLAEYHLIRARLQADQNQLDLSSAEFDRAWEIAKCGPMRLHMADIHLYRARLFHGVAPYPWDKDEKGQPRGPKDDLAAARKLIEQCGYWRRKEELEDAEEAAKNW
jgi:tetratricopeptide (TPR) repeat protein